MKLLYIIAFMSMSVGILSLLKTTPMRLFMDLHDSLSRLNLKKKLSMKKQIQQSVKKRKANGIRQILMESRKVLELTHRSDRLPMYSMYSVFLSVIGILISVLLDNLFLIPVLAIGLALLPWLYILYSATKFKNQLNEEMETALSMITTSYLRSDNIITAVRENIDHINFPVKEVFEGFLFQSDMISSDITQLLENVKGSLDNTIFQDWVDQIILCQDDRNLKSTLQAIVGRLSEVRDVTGELENLMYEPMKEFISMAALALLNIPLIRLMNTEWYTTIMYTPIGQIIIAGTFIALFISLIAAVRKTRPVEYRR